MRTIRKLLACLGVSVACLACMPQLAYATVAGHVQFVNGDVQITNPAGQVRQAQKGDVISEGDTLTSAPSASAQIKMQDGGFVAVRPDTRLKFDQFVFSGKQDGSEKSFFSLFKGGFRAVTGLIGQLNKQNYRITTPAATIGIRGTDHETFMIVPGSPMAQVAPTGAYNKPNTGETTITTDKGTINVLPNQMGFAGGLNQAPQLQPVNTNVFTVATAPAPEAKIEKKGEKKEQAEPSQEQKTAKSEEGKKEGGKETGGEANGNGGAKESAQTAKQEGAATGQAKTEAATEGGATTGAAQGAVATPAPAPAPAIQEAAVIRETAVVDAVAPSAGLIPTASPVTAAPVVNATVIAPPPAPTTVVNTAPITGGTTVNIITGTATTSTGQVIPATQGLFATQAQAAADAALLAANAAATAANTATTDNTALAAVAQVSTASATTAIGTATTGISTASTAVSAATALTPANAATATANATAAQTAATAAATQAIAAQSAFTANGTFADATAAPANTATQNANGSLQTANTAVQTAAGTVTAQNTALTTAQGAASAALTSANTNLTAASTSLTTANTQNTAIVTAQGSTATSLAAAQAAATAAQTAATAAQTAATQAATLQAAGDLAGAQAQLVIAQQQLAIAQTEQANAQTAQAAVTAQLAGAQTAQTAAGAAVTAATNAANTAATDAGTASTQAAAEQTASTNANTALTASTTNLAMVNTNAATVAANAPVAAYNNPAVVGNFFGHSIMQLPNVAGLTDGWSNNRNLNQANTTFVLDGAGNLVEARSMKYAEVAYAGIPAFNTPTITPILNADMKWSGGTAYDTFKLPDNSIYMGRWQGGSVTITDNATVIVHNLGTISNHWILMLAPPANYVQSLVGTTTYTMAGHTSPTDSFGNVGVLNSASLTANFTSQLVNAAVNLTINNKTLDMQALNMPITLAEFGTSSLPNATCTGAGCAGTYQGELQGVFAGSAAASAGISYGIWPVGATTLTNDEIRGLAAFSTATMPTVLTGGPFAAYVPSYTEIGIGAAVFTKGWMNYMAAPADMVYAGAGLSSFIDRCIGGCGETHSYSVAGGITPVTGNATSFGTTGIQFGRWTSATALQSTYTAPLGTRFGAPTTWMYGPQGYLDLNITAPAGQMYGTFTYALDGSSAPYDRQSGRSGTLTNASISANFIAQTVSASIALSVGGQAWSASTTTPVNFANSSQFFAGSTPGGASNNLTVLMGAGTPAACPTCYGNLNGAFTGQNYAGAILSYSLWVTGNAGGGEIVGHAALARTGATITNGTPVATGKYIVADYGGSALQVDTLNNPAGSLLLTPGSVLTAYSSGSSASPAFGYNFATVNCATCTSVAATNATTLAAPTGIYFGTWDAGTFSNTWGGGGLASISPHWITGPEAGPVFLPNALLGTKTFTFDGGMVTNSNGVAGTVLPTTVLTVDFTRQVMGINIDLSINDTAVTPALHTWNAKTLPGNEAIINGSSGIGGAVFQTTSYNGTGPGLLTVRVDGVTPGSGDLSGQLTGTGLNGAILNFNLQAMLGATFESVNGVAALVGATSNIATPHRGVMVSATDPSSIITQPVIGWYANDPTRMLTDVAGNLTKFDINRVNNSGMNNPSKTLAINIAAPPTLTDAGNDPLTGISWGRWAGGSIDLTNRDTGVVKTSPLAGSAHWIAGPTETAAVTLPVSGTFVYTKAGGTLPTDNLGTVGTLNTATLAANFTAQTVNVGVNVTVGTSTLDAAASNVPIIQKTGFYADSRAPLGPQHLVVTCTGSCGASAQGVIVGGFGGAGATGAMMTYGLEKIGGASPGVISGVVGFHR